MLAEQTVDGAAAGETPAGAQGSAASESQTVVLESVERPVEEPEARAPNEAEAGRGRADEGAAAGASVSDATGEVAPEAGPAVLGVPAEGLEGPSAADIPVQTRASDAGEHLGTADTGGGFDARPDTAAPALSEGPSQTAAGLAAHRQVADEATGDDARRVGGLPGTSLERRSGKDAVALTSQWDHHVPPPVNDGFPRAEEVLNQRFITREALNASVPAELQIPHRLQLLKVVSRINHIPPADLVAVAVDWFLRGGSASVDDMLPPWNGYTGHGTPEDIRPAELVLNERFIAREPLKSQVPADLELNHRLAMYRLLNRLDKMPVADIVSVALDRWLRVMRF
ncbi:hypothetical protein [Streptomyces sp. NPDC054865]